MKSKLFKRITAMALALLMVGTAIPSGSDFTGLFGSEITASAATIIDGGECGDNATWSLDSDGKLVIEGNGYMYNYVSGLDPYSTNAPWDKYKSIINSIEIAEGVKSIGNYAFYCYDINKVSIPASVETIGSFAFFYNTDLSELNIAKGSMLKKIDDNAFSYCSNLRELYLPEGTKFIYENAFAEAYALKTIVLPSTLKTVSRNAFYECRSVENIYCFVANPYTLAWPDDGDLNANSFKENKGTVCHVLRGKKTAYETFLGYLNLTFVDDLGGKCGDNAFWTLTDTDGDEKKDKLSIVGTGDMYDYEITANGITSPWYDNRKNITTIEIANGITKIGDYAFFVFTSDDFDSVTIPASVISIGNRAFYSCIGLKTLTFAEGSKLKTIGEYAFTNCTALESVTMPEGVTTIKNAAFRLCTACADVYMLVADPSNIIIWQYPQDSFIKEPAKTTKCHVPAGTLSAYIDKFDETVNVKFVCSGQCGDEAYWELDGDGKLTITGKGAMWDFEYDYDLGTYTTPWYEERDNIETVEIDDNITTIGEYSFFECENLTSANIPAKAAKIGQAAFENCYNLAAITLPEGLDLIGAVAFDSCNTLKEITIPSTLSSIGADAFVSCSGIETLTFATNETTGKSNLATIGNSAFCGCVNIEELVLPEGLKTIKPDAFRACERLKTVTIPSTVTQIGEIEKGDEFTFSQSAFGECGQVTDVYIYVTNVDALTWAGGIDVLKGDAIIDFMYEAPNGSDTGTSSGYKFKLTKCHVPKGTLEAYLAKFSKGEDDDVNVTFVSDPGKITVKKVTGGKVTADKATADMDETVTLTVTPIKGYKLKSLTVKDSANKTVTVNDNKFTMPDLDVTVTPKFETISYTIAYELNGGKNPADAPASYTVESDTITLPTPTRTGYKFGGWFEKKDLSGNAVKTIAKGSTGNKKYYAKWTAETYTIAYKLNGGKNPADAPASYTVESDTITLPTPTRTGYKFGGWFEKKDLSGNAVKTIAKGSTGNKTYYAKWTINKFTLTLPKNMSVVGTSQDSYDYGTVVKFKVSSGYYVIGKVKNGSTVLTAKDGVYSVKITADTTITAITATKVERVEPTCDNDGNIEYYKGSDGKYYLDTDGTEVDPDQIVLKATKHSFGEPSWKWTGTSKASAVFICEHDEKHVETVKAKITSKTTAATCEKDGKTVYTATVTFNGKTYTDTKTVKIDKLGHKYGEPTWTWNGTDSATAKFTCANDSKHVKTVDAKITYKTTKATCEADGKTVYTATVTFNGKTYTDTKTVKIDKLGHKYGEPTWTWNGTDSATAKFTCANDSKHVKTVDAKITYKTTKATCEADGKTVYTATVTFNGKTYTDTKTVKIDKLGHKYGEPIWTWNGTSEASAEFVCANDKTHVKTVAAKITYKTTKATCEADGKTVYTATVTFNGKTYTDTKTVKIDKLGHKFGDWKTVSFNIKKGTSTQKGICAVCGKETTRTVNGAVERIAGDNRYQTAAVISSKSYQTADTVVIACGENYPDALAAVPLAVKLKAPILLSTVDSVPEVTLNEVKRLGAKNVYIVGGEGVVSAEAAAQFTEQGIKVQRLWGDTRYETAVEIAKKVDQLNGKKPEEVFLVYANKFADALSANTAAAVKNSPIIYLSTKGTINPTSKAYLESIKGSVKKAYVIGGTGVISDEMLQQAGEALGVTPERVAGNDRYETCAAVNARFSNILTGKTLCVATGADFIDALAGGVYAAINRSPLMIAAGGLNDAQKEYFKTMKFDRICIFGGTGAFPDKLVEKIAKQIV